MPRKSKYKLVTIKVTEEQAKSFYGLQPSTTSNDIGGGVRKAIAKAYPDLAKLRDRLQDARKIRVSLANNPSELSSIYQYYQKKEQPIYEARDKIWQERQDAIDAFVTDALYQAGFTEFICKKDMIVPKPVESEAEKNEAPKLVAQ